MRIPCGCVTQRVHVLGSRKGQHEQHAGPGTAPENMQMYLG